MATTFFGSVSKPTTENTASSTANESIGPTLSLTPPASMQAGDLVVVAMLYRSTSGTLGVQTTGGQTWETGTQQNRSNARLLVVWCVFNGTWDEDPVFGLTSGTSPLEATMLVFRSDVSSPTFNIDVAEVGETFAAPSTPYDVDSPTLTGAASGAMAVAFWGTGDDNDWTGQTADWTYGRWRNRAGSDQSLAWAYRALPSAGDYTVTNRQTGIVGDAGARTIFSVLESSSGPTTQQGEAAYSGAGTFAATATVVPGPQTINATASYSGSGALASTANVTQAAAATFTGVGTLAATAQRIRGAESTFAAASTFAADGTVIQGGQTIAADVAYTGVGTALSTGQVIRAGAASYATSGTLSTTSALIRTATASYSTSGTLAATGTAAGITVPLTGTLTMAGTLTTVARHPIAVTGTLSASGTVSPAVRVAQAVTGGLTFAGSLLTSYIPPGVTDNLTTLFRRNQTD